jgi:hypothetical protein
VVDPQHFDVDEYIADDLVPRINRNVDALLALKLIGTDGGHEARYGRVR